MTLEDLEVRVQNLEGLKAKVQIIEDVEAIKKLQRAYSYYLEHWEEEQLAALFSNSPDVSIQTNDGDIHKGPEEVRKFFHFAEHYATLQSVKAPPTFLHRLMSLSGIVDVDPDGKTAKGRWYSLGFHAGHTAGELKAKLGSGIWENEYVKEDGKWKIKKLFYQALFYTPYEDGWVKTPYAPDKPEPGDHPNFTRYPSGKVFPYHYKNPVTGK